jgi:cysteine desulfurase
VKVDVSDLGIDALSLSAHKFEGPKGVGALYVKRGTRVRPRVVGGGQEFGKRAGTENVAGIVALATAFELAVREIDVEAPRIAALRDRFVDAICGKIDETALNGSRGTRLPNNASIRFDGTDASGVMIALDLAGVEVSTGSACTSGSLEPSHVLTAIGLPAEKARGTVRFSLGRTSTDAEIDAVIGVLPAIVEKLRGVAASTFAQPLTVR